MTELVNHRWLQISVFWGKWSSTLCYISIAVGDGINQDGQQFLWKVDYVLSGLFETGVLNKLLDITARLDNIQKDKEKSISINFWLNSDWIFSEILSKFILAMPTLSDIILSENSPNVHSCQALKFNEK